MTRYTAAAYTLLTLYGGNTSGGDVAISLYSSKAVLPYDAISNRLLSLALLGVCVSGVSTDHTSDHTLLQLKVQTET